jgi:hypothetical protein
MANRFTRLRMADGRPALIIARENGISLSALEGRLKSGWNIHDAVTRPMVWPPRK